LPGWYQSLVSSIKSYSVLIFCRQTIDLLAIRNAFGPSVLSFLGLIAPHTASMYPTAIILLSALQKTHCDTTLQGPMQTQGTSPWNGSGPFDAHSLSNHVGTYLTFSLDLNEELEKVKQYDDVSPSNQRHALDSGSSHSGPSKPLPCFTTASNIENSGH